MVGYTKKLRRKKQLYYAEHREELLAKKKAEYRAKHPKGLRRKTAAAGESRRKGTSKSKSKPNSTDYYARHREEILLKRKQRYQDNREEILLKRKQKYHDNREEVLLKRKQRYYDDRKAKGSSGEHSKHTLNPEPTKRGTEPRYFIKYSEGLVLRLQKLEVSKDSSEFDRKRQNLEEVVSKIADTQRSQTTLDPRRLWRRSSMCQNSSSLLPSVAAYQGGDSVGWEGDTTLISFTQCQTNFLQEDPMSSVDFSDYKHDIMIVEVDSQPDVSSLLTKSQQKLDEMLTRLETEATNQ